MVESPPRRLTAAIMLTAVSSLLIYGLWLQEYECRMQPAGFEVNVLCAGSLARVAGELAEKFMLEHPYVRVHVSAYGSLECARLVKAGAKCDLLLVSDYNVIEDELAERPQGSARRYCEWWVAFARNEIVLALAPGNPAGINEKNWYWKLADPKVRWGRANPDNDPCGYRTLIVFNVCDTYYPEHRDEFPGYPEAGVLKTLYLAGLGNVFVAEKEYDLMVALQSGRIDAGWTYLSLAKQFGLEYVKLPVNVSLGDPSSEFDKWYSRFTITTEGGRTYRGSSIAYAASIPTTARNPYWAAVFLLFILTEGLAVIEGGGQLPISPPRLMGDPASAPPQIREVCVEV